MIQIKSIEKQNGMVLFIALIILLLLSIVVYSGLYSGQLQESMATDTGRGAVKTDQAAESLIADIESTVFAEGAAAAYSGTAFPTSVCAGNTCSSISMDILKDINSVSDINNGFKQITKNDIATTYYKVQNLGTSDNVPEGNGALFQLYRITAVSFFADSKSAIESLIALPVKK